MIIDKHVLFRSHPQIWVIIFRKVEVADRTLFCGEGGFVLWLLFYNKLPVPPPYIFKYNNFKSLSVPKQYRWIY